ncbi:hypothetical protein [Agrilutibacter solisilvae]|uniref:VCBS repeat-containing protein n=1 Tax=Agrilutibacter solisilvae TaxID=2763317 RepID=A0A974XYT7_9GAMM|nr:hypothetical protein [Lysobacter solisilvae]QSX77355.1 hypothetical protein I8J32_011315 [Lysobacter solisilvae]
MLLASAAAQSQAASKDAARFVPDGMRVEAELATDLTGDGRPDLAFIAGNDETRVLRVLARFRVEAAPGQEAVEDLEPIDSMTLEVTPLGPGTLSARKGVLIVEDLVGGTTATAATYRFRFDPAEDRMRLIGIDAERYSRTNSHGGIELSWNLLNGAHLVQSSRLAEGAADDGAYRFSTPQRTVQKVEKVFMDATPNPDELIDNEIAAQMAE